MNENFESYNIDDEEDGNSVKRFTMWSIVPQIMVTPSSGWARARNNGPSPELATIRFFLPICLLTGASVFFSALYPGALSTTEENGFTLLLVNSVIQFCSFFIGYYLALVLAKLFLPKEDRNIPSSPFGKLLIMTGVATLALFHILFEAFRMLDFIFEFLPLWTIFLIIRGIDFIEVRSDKKVLVIAVLCLVTVISPTLVRWILALFA